MPVKRMFVNMRPTGKFEAKQEQNRKLSKSVATYITLNNRVKTIFSGACESETILSL